MQETHVRPQINFSDCYVAPLLKLVTLKVSYRNETPRLHSHKVYSCKEKSHNLLNSALPRMLSVASNNVFNNRRDLLASVMERPRDRFRKAFILELSNVTKF